MAYIEPCCCERQLPALVKGAAGHFCFFQTSGDVTLQKMLDAVAYMAGDGHTLLLSVAEVDREMLKSLAYYFRRGWTRGLLLVTQTDQRSLVEQELGQWITKVHYAADPLILDGLCAVIGSQEAVIIQGAMLSSQDFSLCQYALWQGSDREVLSQAIDPLIAKLRTKRLLDASESSEEVARVLGRQYFEI